MGRQRLLKSFLGAAPKGGRAWETLHKGETLMTKQRKSFIAFDIEGGTISRHSSRAAAQKAINEATGRIPGVGWDETLLRVAGVEVRVSEKAERAGRELFALVFEDFPLARKTVDEQYGMHWVDWDSDTPE